MMIHIAEYANSDPLWRWAWQHTLKVAPREINKSYDDYDCAVYLDGRDIIAYVFFWCRPPNVGEIHRFAFKPDREDALLECINAVFAHLEERGVREITTYITGDNEWELELYKRLGFGMTTIRPMLRTNNWWKSEGIDKKVELNDVEYKDLRKLKGESGLMSHNIII